MSYFYHRDQSLYTLASVASGIPTHSILWCQRTPCFWGTPFSVHLRSLRSQVAAFRGGFQIALLKILRCHGHYEAHCADGAEATNCNQNYTLLLTAQTRHTVESPLGRPWGLSSLLAALPSLRRQLDLSIVRRPQTRRR
jgi:hypothetical protein